MQRALKSFCSKCSMILPKSPLKALSGLKIIKVYVLGLPLLLLVLILTPSFRSHDLGSAGSRKTSHNLPNHFLHSNDGAMLFTKIIFSISNPDRFHSSQSSLGPNNRFGGWVSRSLLTSITNNIPNMITPATTYHSNQLNSKHHFKILFDKFNIQKFGGFIKSLVKCKTLKKQCNKNTIYLPTSPLHMKRTRN